MHFADAIDLDIVEIFADKGNTGEAFSAAFRQLAQDDRYECGLLIPALSVLGRSRREVRGRMAALRELGSPLYEMERNMCIPG